MSARSKNKATDVVFMFGWKETKAMGNLQYELVLKTHEY